MCLKVYIYYLCNVLLQIISGWHDYIEVENSPFDVDFNSEENLVLVCENKDSKPEMLSNELVIRIPELLDNLIINGQTLTLQFMNKVDHIYLLH